MTVRLYIAHTAWVQTYPTGVCVFQYKLRRLLLLLLIFIYPCLLLLRLLLIFFFLLLLPLRSFLLSPFASSSVYYFYLSFSSPPPPPAHLPFPPPSPFPPSFYSPPPHRFTPSPSSSHQTSSSSSIHRPLSSSSSYFLRFQHSGLFRFTFVFPNCVSYGHLYEFKWQTITWATAAVQTWKFVISSFLRWGSPPIARPPCTRDNTNVLNNVGVLHVPTVIRTHDPVVRVMDDRRRHVLYTTLVLRPAL